MHLGVFYLRASRTADVTTDIDDIDAVCHIYFPLVHVVEHLLGTFRPYLIISTMPKESNGDYYIAFKRQALLRFQELLLEASAAAEGDYFVFSNHICTIIESFLFEVLRPLADNRRQAESNQVYLNCRGANEEAIADRKGTLFFDISYVQSMI